ncbi:hypothetical protein WA158_003847 [Blastocystis sp. Blastoise]
MSSFEQQILFELSTLKGSLKLLQKENDTLKVDISHVKENNEKLIERIETLEKVNKALLEQITQTKNCSSQINDVTETTIQQENNKLESQENDQLMSSVFLDSCYLNNKVYYELLNSWVKEEKNNASQFQLLYKGSQDTYTKESFGTKCIGKGSLLIIIESTDGSIFGGFTLVGLSGHSGWTKDKNAFLFTLNNTHKVPPTKFHCRAGKTAVYEFTKDYLFSFGSNEVLISEHCDQNQLSRTKELWSYDCLYDSEHLLTPTEFFTVKDIEVYSC